MYTDVNDRVQTVLVATGVKALVNTAARVTSFTFDSSDMTNATGAQTLTFPALSEDDDCLVSDVVIRMVEAADTAGDLSALTADIGFSGSLDVLYDGAVLDDNTTADFLVSTDTPVVVPAAEDILVTLAATGDTLDDIVTGEYVVYILFSPLAV